MYSVLNTKVKILHSWMTKLGSMKCVYEHDLDTDI